MELTYEVNRNPLRVDELPPKEDMALRYRIPVNPNRDHHWPFVLFAYAFLSLPLVIVIAVGSSYLVSGFWLALLSLLLAVAACGALAHHLGDETTLAAWRARLTFLGAIILIWVAARFLGDVSATPATQLLLLATAIAGSAFLADRMCTHYVAWMVADPRLSDGARIRFHAMWKDRFTHPVLCSPTFRYTFIARVGDYPASFGLLLAAFVLSTILALPFARLPNFGLAFVLLLAATLAILTVAWLLLGQNNPRSSFLRSCRALATWLFYDPDDSPAPGVFKSSVGRAVERRRLTAAAVFLLSLAILPFAAYFPIVPNLDDQTQWLSAAQRPFFWEENLPPQPPNFDALTPREETYLQKLPRSERESYVESLRLRKQQAYESAQAQADYVRFANTPHAWVMAAIRGTFRAESRFVVALLCGLVASLFVPPALFLALFVLTTSRTLTLLHDELDRELGASHQHRRANISTDWDAYVHQLQASPLVVRSNGKPVRERDHLWLGVNAEYHYPVLLDRHILHEHGHILGDSGSGKTALALAPMIAQFARLSGRLKDDPNSAIDQQFSLVIIDLKGDRSLFHGAKIEAERAGLPFKWFTNIRDHATYGFNPLTQAHIRHLTVSQQSEILIQALGLQYGEFYGAGYFSSINQTVLRRYLKKYQAEIHSFEDLNSKTQSPALYQSTFDDSSMRKSRRDDWREAGHLLTRIDALASVPAINVTPQLVERGFLPTAVLDQQIDMGDVLRRPQVVYFYLSSITETAAVQGIAKLALYALLTAADRFEPGSYCRAYVFIDEFQQIVANNLELVLRQARSKNISCILANQNLTDLETPDGNLMHTVEANTAFKQVFRATSLEQRDYLKRSSGVTMYHLASNSTGVSFGGGGGENYSFSTSTSETPGYRFQENDVIGASYADTDSLVHISKGSGFTRYGGYLFGLRSTFHIPAEEYQRRSQDPWPETDDHPGTLKAVDLDANRSRAESNQPFTRPPAAPQPFAPPVVTKPAPDQQTLFEALEAFKKGPPT